MNYTIAALALAISVFTVGQCFRDDPFEIMVGHAALAVAFLCVWLMAHAAGVESAAPRSDPQLTKGDTYGDQKP